MTATEFSTSGLQRRPALLPCRLHGLCRRAFGFALFCALCHGAWADDADDRLSRLLVDHLSPATRSALSLSPKQSGPTSGSGPLEVEIYLDCTGFRWTWLRVDVSGDSATMLMVEGERRLRPIIAWPGHLDGCRFSEATLGLNEFSCFATDLWRLAHMQQARPLKKRGSRAPWVPLGGVHVQAGDQSWLDGPLGLEIPSVRDPVSGKFRWFPGDDVAFKGLIAGLVQAYVRERTSTWTRRPATKGGRERMGEYLSQGLAEQKKGRERLRVLTLGYMGHDGASAALKGLLRSRRSGRSSERSLIRDALRQIELRAECVPDRRVPGEVVTAYLGESEWWARWARDVLVEAHGDGFVDLAAGWFREPMSPDLCSRIIGDVREVSPKRVVELARAGIHARSAYVRCESALILRDTKTLVHILRSKKLVHEDDFLARLTAIQFLQFDAGTSDSDKDLAVHALMSALGDPEEDIRIRGEAAARLSGLMSEESRGALARVAQELSREGQTAKLVYLGDPRPDNIDQADFIWDFFIPVVSAIRRLRVIEARPYLALLGEQVLSKCRKRVARSHPRLDRDGVNPEDLPYFETQGGSRDVLLLGEIATTLAWLGGGKAMDFLEKLDKTAELYAEDPKALHDAYEIAVAVRDRDMATILKLGEALGVQPLGIYLAALFPRTELAAQLENAKEDRTFARRSLRAAIERADAVDGSR